MLESLVLHFLEEILTKKDIFIKMCIRNCDKLCRRHHLLADVESPESLKHFILNTGQFSCIYTHNTKHHIH